MFKIGVDEAGRGPWAGPVFAGIVVLTPEQESILLSEGVNDSKKLTEKKREKLFEVILKNSLYSKVKFHSVEVIDELGIYEATKDLIHQLVSDNEFVDFVVKHSSEIKILIDGTFPGFKLPYDHECIIRGDSLEPSISAASILAKVRRDAYMMKLHEKYPEYEFAKHKGYGTKLHHEKLKEFGVIEEHRRSFKPISEIINSHKSPIV